MEKRALVAVILSILVLVVWQTLFAPKPKRDLRGPGVRQGEPRLRQEEPGIPTDREEAVPPGTLERSPPKKEEEPAPISEAPRFLEEKEVVVSTPLYRVVITSRGARLKSVELKEYAESIEKPKVMKLLSSWFGGDSPEGRGFPRVHPLKNLIDSNLEGNLPLGTGFYSKELPYVPEMDFASDRARVELDENGGEARVVFTATSPGGIKASKEFTFFSDRYQMDVRYAISNPFDYHVSGEAAVEWFAEGSSADEGGGGLFGARMGNVRRFAYFINGNVVRKEIKDISEEKSFTGDIAWAGFEDKYFISAVVPHGKEALQLKLGRDRALVSSRLVYSDAAVPPGEEAVFTYSCYMGPKDLYLLEAQGVHLEKAINFGTYLDVVAKPILVSLKFFYKYFHNYGLAIIMLTVIIKRLFWPLTHKSMKSMKEMQKVQPEMKKLREQYKDNKEELNRRVMELYRTHKVNPLGGCLPILLQIPVFFALYRVLLDSIELRHASFISFWINDLSTKDPTYVSPLLMGASMFLQQKMTPTAADPAQAKMMLFMPIVFTFMFLNFPSGLVIYWLVNNVLSIVQQSYLNRSTTT